MFSCTPLLPSVDLLKFCSFSKNKYLYSGGSRISRRGGVDPLGGRGPPMQVLFGENECENQWRIQDFPLGGGADLRRIHFLAKTYVKTKEMDPVGGAPAAPPGSANENERIESCKGLDPPMLKKQLGWVGSREKPMNVSDG